MSEEQTPLKFDERLFYETHRKEDPTTAMVLAFFSAARVDQELRLRVLTKLRSEAAASPAAVLAMFALGISALSFFVNLLLAIVGADSVSANGVWFWLGEAMAIIVLALLGVALFVISSRRYRAAVVWKQAFEDALS